jgi:hypothetical protein
MRWLARTQQAVSGENNGSPNSIRSLRMLIRVSLAAQGIFLIWAAALHSPTWDEVAQLPAGISHWELGRFDLSRVNPPLVRMAAAIPVIFAGAKTDWRQYPEQVTYRADFAVGTDFFKANNPNAFWYLTYARWACIPFTLLGGICCLLWATRLYGQAAGLIALWMWCVCPNIIAHGHLMTPDVAAASLGAWAAYGFWRWLRSPIWSTAAVAAILMGLVELIKTTWIILFPLWLIIWVLWNVSSVRLLKRSQWISQAWQLSAILLVAAYVINLGYGFEGSFTGLGNYEFISRSLAGNALKDLSEGSGKNRFDGTLVGHLPVPFPKNYLQGIDRQKYENEKPDWSYLRGEWRSVGWYYYYLYAMMIKTPIGTQLILLMALAMTLLPSKWASAAADRQPADHADCGLTPPVTWRDEMVLLIPMAAILLFVSSQTGFNRHLRYVLPAFPFLFIWGSRVAQAADFHWLAKLPTRARGAILDLIRSRSRRVAVAGLANYRIPPPADITPHVPFYGVVQASSHPTIVEPAGRKLTSRMIALSILSALVWSTVSSLAAYPHSLSYFNEFVGGSKNGHWHLDDSNVDWGQDLFLIKAWFDEHPEARPFHLKVGMPLIDPQMVGIEYDTVPPGPSMNRKHRPNTVNWPWGEVDLVSEDSSDPNPADDVTMRGPRPGWYAISLGKLHDRKGEYEYFSEFDPIAIIGYSTHIYRITLDGAIGLRRRLGLSELNDESSAPERPDE